MTALLDYATPTRAGWHTTIGDATPSRCLPTRTPQWKTRTRPGDQTRHQHNQDRPPPEESPTESRRWIRAQLADLRKQAGLTPAQLAAATPLTQARISQIEHGTDVSLDVLRAYITGLGGHVEIVARLGTTTLNIA